MTGDRHGDQIGLVRMSPDFVDDLLPLWVDRPLIDGEEVDFDAVLSARLRADLMRWNHEFALTSPRGHRMKPHGYVPNDWDARGLRLAWDVRGELGPSWRVDYRP